MNSCLDSDPTRFSAPASTPTVPWPVASMKILPQIVQRVSLVLWLPITARMRPSSATTSSMFVLGKVVMFFSIFTFSHVIMSNTGKAA